jgi:zinc/manganese transport system substrate-binding protein
MCGKLMPMKLRWILTAYVAFSAMATAAELKVVSMHPLMTDLLKQVGGDQVEVIDLIGPKGDPHSFKPRTETVAAISGVKVYFLSGMGLESYLPELRSILPAEVRMIEVGASLPALHGACEHEGHDHKHETDPHWWHSVDLFRRATTRVAEELSKEFPEQRSVFEANARSYRKKLDELEKWLKREILKIPKDRRKLATAHSAFQYFCEAYGFEPYAVQGLNREQMPGAAELAALMKSLKAGNVIAIFPERESNPKILASLTRDNGIKLGGELIADGRGVHSYEEMMRSNVNTIVAALSAE